MFVVVIIGGGTTGYQSLSNAISLNLTEPSHQGRVQSLLQLSFAGFGIAAFPLGLFAEAVGRRQAMALMGVIATAAILTYAAIERSAQDEIEAGDPEPAQASAQTPDMDDRSPATELNPSARPARQ